MKCFECGGAMIQTEGTVKMTKKDGGMIIFRNIPLAQCRQCGEQYVPGKWSERIGEMLRNEDTIVSEEIMSVPVVVIHN